jgi:hypothetical protein
MSTDVAFVCAKDMAVSTSTRPFSIVTFQDGSVAVVYSVPRTPRVLEVIAIFSEAARARDYADRENSRSAEPATEPTENPSWRGAPRATRFDARSIQVLAQLVRHAVRTRWKRRPPSSPKAANVPLGSLHSVLHTLEKKQLIKTVRAGSVRAPALYQVL